MKVRVLHFSNITFSRLMGGGGGRGLFKSPGGKELCARVVRYVMCIVRYISKAFHLNSETNITSLLRCLNYLISISEPISEMRRGILMLVDI